MVFCCCCCCLAYQAPTASTSLCELAKFSRRPCFFGTRYTVELRVLLRAAARFQQAFVVVLMTRIESWWYSAAAAAWLTRRLLHRMGTTLERRLYALCAFEINVCLATDVICEIDLAYCFLLWQSLPLLICAFLFLLSLTINKVLDHINCWKHSVAFTRFLATDCATCPCKVGRC